jgi:predicted nucleic acid-binding protein
MIIVDSNIILDIVTKDHTWYDWSSSQLQILAESHRLVINDIIYSEISVSFKHIEELENILTDNFIIQPIPREALFLAGKIFLNYKQNTSGTKTSTLPDFFIGAHASILNIPLLTRDKKRYKNYFPKLEIIAP